MAKKTNSTTPAMVAKQLQWDQFKIYVDKVSLQLQGLVCDLQYGERPTPPDRVKDVFHEISQGLYVADRKLKDLCHTLKMKRPGSIKREPQGGLFLYFGSIRPNQKKRKSRTTSKPTK